MGDRDQQDGQGIVQGDLSEQRLVAVVGDGSAEVLHRAPVGHDIDKAPDQAVGAESEDQGGDAEEGHADAVEHAHRRADRHADEEHLADAAAALGDKPCHGCREPQGCADGDVDLAGHDDKRDADGQQCVHGGGIEAVDNIGIGQEVVIGNTGNQEQQNQEHKAGHPACLE